MTKKENYSQSILKNNRKIYKNEKHFDNKKYSSSVNKLSWKAGNMLYPLPAIMVSLTTKEGNSNIITLAWAGTICTNPPMLSVSIRPERYSYDIIKETGEFVVNLTTKELTYATDYCGVKSGRDVDKFKEMKLTKLASEKIKAVAIAESPVNIECKVREIMELGSHSLFIADVVNVRVDGKLLDEKGRFNLAKSELIAYSHGRYYELGKELGTFGYSIRKESKTGNKPQNTAKEVKIKKVNAPNDKKNKFIGKQVDSRRKSDADKHKIAKRR